jgi:PAS domain S-box-containing protein
MYVIYTKQIGENMKNHLRFLPIMIILSICLHIVLSRHLYAQEQQNQEVLVLHSYHRGLSWDDGIDRGIKSVFEKSNLDIETQFEYMDTKRIHDPEYLDQLYGIYKYKFRNRRFNGIISTDNNAFNFLLKHRDDLFPQTSVVFCGVNNFQENMLEGQSLYTGVVEAVDIKETIDMALALHPKTRQVVIYGSGTPTYFANKIHLENIIPDYKGAVEFRFVENLNIRQVQDDIRKLPLESIIFIMSSIKDENGIPMDFQRFPEMMATVSNVPIYSCWGFFLGHGIVGGKLISGFSQGETAAQMTLRVLTGENINNIPVLKQSPNPFMFDYRQMRRFGLELPKLPKESIVINKPQSLYSEHKGLIWSVVCAFVTLTLLILFLVFNIFRRRRAENELKQSEEKYRDLFDNALDTIFTIDMEGKFLEVNDAFLREGGYQREDIIGRNFAFMVHPDDAAIASQSFEKGKQGRPFEFEMQVKKKDGTYNWYSFVNRPIFGENGAVSALHGVARNITGRKQAEEKTRQSGKRFRDLFNSITDLIYTQDLEGRFLTANPALTKIFGYSKEEFIGRRITEFMKPELRSLFEREYLGQLKTKGYHKGTTVYFTKDNRKIYIEYRSALVKPEKGEPYISGTGRDVTDRILTERKLKKLQDQMLQAKKMESIGVLAGGIAHDFNNLLMGILGNTSLMLMAVDSNHPGYEKLKNIEQYVQSGADLTKQLLGFARGGKYEVIPTDLNELIKKQSRMFGRTKKEVNIHGKYEDDLWIAEVDQGQIEQVILNLYINAWQAMPGGGDLYVQTENVTLDERYVRPFELTPGKYVKISITDTGAGMEEEISQRIFDPFFTTKEMGRGTGLGLASAYGIIKNHGGMINVYSEKGEGTTFNIYLPASTSEVRAQGSEVSEDIRHGDETILLVDDEDIIVDVGKEMLKTLGYRVIVAQSGKEAIDAYRANQDKIDMILLDMVMPGIGGGETFDRLKEINPDIRVLLSSGYSINGQAQDILDRGCIGFIQKPFNMKEISGKIREVLEPWPRPGQPK